MKSSIKFSLFFLSVALMFSCAKKPDYAKKPPVFKDIYTEMKKEEVKETEKEKIELEKEKKEEKIVKHKVEIVKLPSPIKTPKSGLLLTEKKIKTISQIYLPVQGDVQISVEDIPIYDFINLVFGKILNVNYIVSPDVQKIRDKITINMVEPMKPKEFLGFVINLLKKYQVSVEYQNGIFKIEKAKKTRVSIYSDKIIIGRIIDKRLPPDEKISVIVPTYYVDPQKLISTLSLFIPPQKNLLFTRLYYANAILISGEVEGLRKTIRLISILDRPFFENKQIYLIKLEYITPEDFKKEISKILKNIGIPVATDPSKQGILLVPLDKLNALLVVSPKEEWINTIKFWASRIDTLESLGEDVRLFTYKTKNRSAKEVREILDKLLGNISPKIEKKEKKETTKQKKTAAKKTSQTKKAILPFENFNVVVDEERNTLIISAYPSDWKKIKQLLKRIDTPPKQILIEVTIAELTLSDELKYGLEWYLKHTSKDMVGTINFLSGSGGAGAAGVLYTLTGTSGRFQAILSAFASKNLVNIISTPHVVVLDGKSASINVGTQVPVVTSESTSPDLAAGNQPSILRNIQYRSTGVNLSVTPTVTSEGKLRIKISQSLSEVQGYAPGLNSPIILNRSINTEVTLRSGETVLLGGLISETEGKGENKVPVLGDIPILGHLFKIKSKERKKTELIVEITPYILNKSDELDELTQKFIQSTNIFQKYEEKLTK
jgi:general secretion pathway protein D